MTRIARDTATWIALLRAVNVGGHANIGMADLRGLLSRLRFTDPRSLLQSGNLVFGGAGQSGEALETLLETEAARRLSLRTDFFVRSATEWRAIVDGNPFREEAERDPARLAVMCLKRAPSVDDIRALHSAIAGPETIAAAGRQLYAVYPDGMGRSKLTTALIERTLRTRGTVRNWNTVRKLQALVDG